MVGSSGIWPVAGSMVVKTQVAMPVPLVDGGR